MDISLFLEFAKIAKHGNMSEATKELNLTQPVLSRHVSTIEKDVGAELFDRTTNPMKLTPVGEKFLPYASRIGSEYEKYLAFVASLSGKTFGTFRLGGIISSAATPLLQKAKQRFEDQNPTLTVKYLPSAFQTSFNLLRSNQLDIAIEPMSTMIDNHGCISVELVTEASYVVMDENNLLSEKEALYPSDLASLRFTSLRSNRDYGMRKHLQGLCERYGMVGGIPQSLLMENAETLDELFLYGLGENAIMLPESTARQYAEKPGSGLVTRPFLGEESDFNIHAFFRKDPDVKTAQFIRMLEEVRDELGGGDR